MIACTPKHLPRHQWIAAARAAVAEDPRNAPAVGLIGLVAAGIDGGVTAEHIAVMTTKYWRQPSPGAPLKLTVGFLDNPDLATRRLILGHMNAWRDRDGNPGPRANVSFVESVIDPQVRVSREAAGYWSYVGTDLLSIPAAQPTMNLQGFTSSTPDSEYRRVVRHETGHTLGCPHEHMRKEIIKLLDPSRVIPYFEATQGWSREEVVRQILTPIPESALIATPAEADSVMCYQFDGSVTYSGQPIPGGTDITADDYGLMARIMPGADPGPPPVVPPAPTGPLPVIEVGDGIACAYITTPGQPSTFTIHGTRSAPVRLFVFFANDWNARSIVRIHNDGGPGRTINMAGAFGRIPAFPGGPLRLDVGFADPTKVGTACVLAEYPA